MIGPNLFEKIRKMSEVITMDTTGVLKRKESPTVVKKSMKKPKFTLLPLLEEFNMDINKIEKDLSKLLYVPELLQLIWSFILPIQIMIPTMDNYAPPMMENGLLQWKHYTMDYLYMQSLGKLITIFNRRLIGIIAPSIFQEHTVFIDSDRSFLGQYCRFGLFPNVKILYFKTHVFLENIMTNIFPNLEYIYFAGLPNDLYPRSAGYAFDRIGFFEKCFRKMMNQSRHQQLTVWYPENISNKKIFDSVRLRINGTSTNIATTRRHITICGHGPISTIEALKQK